MDPINQARELQYDWAKHVLDKFEKKTRADYGNYAYAAGAFQQTLQTLLANMPEKEFYATMKYFEEKAGIK